MARKTRTLTEQLSLDLSKIGASGSVAEALLRELPECAQRTAIESCLSSIREATESAFETCQCISAAAKTI